MMITVNTNENYKCDICGKNIPHIDFKNGATHELIQMIDEWNPHVYDTVCIKCNKEFKK